MNIKSWSNINKTLNQRIIGEDLCKINKGVITLTHIITSHSNYLILYILNYKKRKILKIGLLLCNIIFNILAYISKKIRINLMNKKYTQKKLCYVISVFKQ
jgi:hypothetical protein